MIVKLRHMYNDTADPNRQRPVQRLDHIIRISVGRSKGVKDKYEKKLIAMQSETEFRVQGVALLGTGEQGVSSVSTCQIGG